MYPLFYLWYKGKNVSKLMEFKSRIHEIDHDEFTHYYDIYDSLPNRETDLSSQSIDFILEELKDHKDAKIIDIGCGGGYLLKKLQAHGFTKLSGLDIHPPKLDPSIKIYSSNVEQLPFEDNSFDIVLCNHMIEHVLSPEKTISELKRIAKKKLIVTLPCQRYNRYTFELHINFYPQASYVQRALNVADSKCLKIAGDWSYVANF